MDNEMRLARVDLGPGWIDLSYGEPIVIQEILKKKVDIKDILQQSVILDAKYQPPQGNKMLVDFLEQKYKAKVVITNGAKQGLAATIYALKKMGHKSCAIKTPHWTSTPNIITTQGLHIHYLNTEDCSASSMLITSPNNPDGKELSCEELRFLTEEAKSHGIALIHDAAYYTPIYSKESTFIKVGDAQVYSVAKMYGLSGLRVGYVVIHDERLLSHISEYIEKSCSGVSTASQAIVLSIEEQFARNPELKDSFLKEARATIASCRKELENLDPEVLEIQPCDSNSMFAWGKIGHKLDHKKAKVNMLSGDLFGQPGFMRLNLAVNSDLIKTAVTRLNEGKDG